MLRRIEYDSTGEVIAVHETRQAGDSDRLRAVARSTERGSRPGDLLERASTSHRQSAPEPTRTYETRSGRGYHRDGPDTEGMLGIATRLALTTAERLDKTERSVADMEKRLSTGGGPQNPFNSFGDFLRSARRAVEGGGEPDKRLETRAAGMTGSGDPADGGYLLPVDYANTLLDLAYYSAPIASRCTRIPAKARSLALPGYDETSRANGSRYGGVVSGWGDEGTLVQSGKPKFRRVELNLHKLSAAIYGTEELSDDSALSFFVGNAFAAEAAFVLDDMVLNGPGADRPLGILNAPATIIQAKEGGQPVGTLAYANVTNMFSRMLPECLPSAVWLMSQEVFAGLYSMAPMVGGGPASPPALFTSPDAEAPFGRLMTRPIIPVEQCATTGTVGDIVFADLSRYFILEKPVNFKMSLHVRFVNGEVVYRFDLRCDGAPIIKSAITPKNGGSTKSAFISLAAR